MYSTFNIPPNFEGLCARRQMSENPMYNTYYQWVAIFLIFQSLFFYMPRVVWLMMEGGEWQPVPELVRRLLNT